MSQTFTPGDYLVFQLESGYGLLRVLGLSAQGKDQVWHVCVFEELFPDIESAEQALAHPEFLHHSKPHLALTDRALERTPTAKLGNRPLDHDELALVAAWQKGTEQTPYDRSLLLLLGMR